MRVVGHSGPASAVGDAAQSLRHHAANSGFTGTDITFVSAERVAATATSEPYEAMCGVRGERRTVPSWIWLSVAGIGFVVLVVLCVLVFPRWLGRDSPRKSMTQLKSQGTDKLVAAEDARSNG